MEHRDIFISYKADVAGNSFAARLYNDLVKQGYSVFFNGENHKAGRFPDHIRAAITDCKDFLLILTQSCLEQLMRHEKIDWVREELLIAHELNKKIIPLLMPGVSMPKDRDDMPEDLRFLPDEKGISIAEPYDKSPLAQLFGWMDSMPKAEGAYAATYNSNPDRSINEEYRRAWERAKDDPEAAYLLANLHFYGLYGDENGCVRDYSAVREYTELLTATDSCYTSHAHALIGEMYYHGVMPREGQSYRAALEHHEIAKAKNGFSAREAAYFRSRGCGCEFDYQSIIDSYTEAIDSGDLAAISGLAKFYLSYGKYAEAAELYQKTGKVLPDAEYHLGMLYREGVLENPPRPDFFRAAFYFQHAISTGNCNSEVYHQLGRLYLTPVGDFPKDFPEAEKCFRIAADMGNVGAQYKLGLMYEYGYVHRDPEKAVHYHTLAAERGNVLAAYHLALIYQQPEVRDYQAAYKYAEQAAKKGLMEAEFLFGVFLYYGRGCLADENRAYKYLRRAYDRGMPAAKLFMDRIDGKTPG